MRLVKEKALATKKILGMFVICTLCCCLIAPAQEQQNKQESQELINELTFSLKMDGIILNFVLLNDKTVDIIFSGSSKYAMRARANQTTIFYVHGTADKDIDFNPGFSIIQDFQTISTKPTSIKNFQTASVAEGTRVEGLLQLPRKINVFQPFKLVDAKDKKFPEYQYSDEAIDIMGI